VSGNPQLRLNDLFGQVIQFGAKDNLSIETPPITSPFSLSLWVNPDAVLGGHPAPALSVGGAQGPYWALMVSGTGSGLAWSDAAGQNQQWLDLDQPLPPGQWTT